MSDMANTEATRAWGVGNWPKVDLWTDVLSIMEQRQYVAAYNFVTTTERLNSLSGRNGTPNNIIEWDQVVAGYNAERVAKYGENCKGLYRNTKSFQGAYSKYKRHIFDLIPSSENTDQGVKMQRAGVLKQARQRNHNFLRATQDAKKYQAPLDVVPGYVLEAGHIYPEIGMKYIKNVGRTHKRDILEPEKRGQEDYGELSVSEQSYLDADAAGEEEKKKHKSTYVLDVVHKKKFDKPEFWNVMMMEWMGKWPNPIAKHDPFTPLLRIGLITNQELMTYEMHHDYVTNFENINESLDDGFEGHDVDIDDDRMNEIAEELNLDQQKLGMPPQSAEYYEGKRLEYMKGMVLLLSALSILPM